MTRPEIASAVRNEANFCEKPGVAQKKAVEKIPTLHTEDYESGHHLRWSGQDRRLEMFAYANSDHATCNDTRRSVSGGAVLLGSNMIS